MPFTHPYHRFADKVAELIVSCDIRLIVVDDAEQLNENGFAVLHDLVAQTGRPVVLIGDEHRLSVTFGELRLPAVRSRDLNES